VAGAELERRPYLRPMVLNALADPVAVLVGAVVLIAGILLSALPVLGPVALVLYLLGAARTLFDDDTQLRVIERAKGRQRSALARAAPTVDPATLAPPVRARVRAVLDREARIREAVDRAELPYAEVLDEVDAFVRATEGTARRAQLLHEGLEDNPPEAIARRVGELGADHPELREALTHQLAVQRRMEKQLGRFYDEMDRLAVELDTIRGEMLTASAAEGSASQRETAAEVRALRERMGAVSEGMAAAYEEEPAAGPS